MDIKIKVNGTLICESVSPDLLLLDFLRKHGCYSVKRGCETANCGLCTVLLDGTPVLSCSVLCARADGHLGDAVRKGDVLAYMYIDDMGVFEEAKKRLLGAYTVEQRQIKPEKLVKDIVV